jgi:hypothetical protein
MLEAAALQKNDVAVGLIEENLRFAPELSIFPSRVIVGTNYEAVIASGDPTVGFTAANDGPALTKTTLRKEMVTCGIFRGAVEIDLAVERASQGSGLPSLESIESSRIAQGAMRYIGRQIFYGTSYDSKGFVGLKAFTPKTAAAGTSEIVVDATGTTAGTATSIYAVKFGIQDIHLVFGANQTLELSEFRDQQLTNSTTGGKFAGRVAELTAYIGMQRINITSVGRVLDGMHLLSAVPRSLSPGGFYTQPALRTPIRRIALASALPEAERPRLEVMDTGSASFEALVEARRNRADAWYLRKAGHIDLCNVPIPVRPAPDR